MTFKVVLATTTFLSVTFSTPLPDGFYPDSPPNYSYGYKVNGEPNGPVFSLKENRNNYDTKGEYNVNLPDGQRQTVVYNVHGGDGYIADVTYDGKPVYPRTQYKPRPFTKHKSQPYSGLTHKPYSKPEPEVSPYSGFMPEIFSNMNFNPNPEEVLPENEPAPEVVPIPETRENPDESVKTYSFKMLNKMPTLKMPAMNENLEIGGLMQDSIEPLEMNRSPMDVMKPALRTVPITDTEKRLNQAFTLMEETHSPIEMKRIPMKVRKTALKPSTMKKVEALIERDPVQEVATPILKVATPIEINDTPMEMIRSNPMEIIRSNPMDNIRSNPMVMVKSNPMEKIRSGLMEMIRSNPIENPDESVKTYSFKMVNKTPMKEITTSIEENAALIRMNPAPIEKDLAPIEENLAPIEGNLTPIENNAALIEENTAPIVQNIAPIEDNTTPIEENAALIEQLNIAHIKENVDSIEGIATLSDMNELRELMKILTPSEMFAITTPIEEPIRVVPAPVKIPVRVLPAPKEVKDAPIEEILVTDDSEMMPLRMKLMKLAASFLKENNPDIEAPMNEDTKNPAPIEENAPLVRKTPVFLRENTPIFRGNPAPIRLNLPMREIAPIRIMAAPKVISNDAIKETPAPIEENAPIIRNNPIIMMRENAPFFRVNPAPVRMNLPKIAPIRIMPAPKVVPKRILAAPKPMKDAPKETIKENTPFNNFPMRKNAPLIRLDPAPTQENLAPIEDIPDISMDFMKIVTDAQKILPTVYNPDYKVEAPVEEIEPLEEEVPAPIEMSEAPIELTDAPLELNAAPLELMKEVNNDTPAPSIDDGLLPQESISRRSYTVPYKRRKVWY